VIRSFVALDLPGPLVDAVAGWQEAALGPVSSVRAIRPEALHVTLAFLGDRTPDEVERTAAVLGSLEVAPLPLRLAAAPVGVPERRPRVIAFDAESPAAVALQGVLAARLVEEGLLAPEGRPFWPHLSVGRVRGRVDLGRLPPLPRAATEHLFAVRVALYRSELRTQGSHYESLAAIDLPPPAANEVI
jgi:2'-5' RNA ligase